MTTGNAPTGAPVPELFVDGIGRVAFTGGTVRIELICASPFDAATPDASDPPLVPRQRLILPLDGFLRSFGILQNLVNRLAEEGAVKRTEPAPGAPAPNVPASPGGR